MHQAGCCHGIWKCVTGWKTLSISTSNIFFTLRLWNQSNKYNKIHRTESRGYMSCLFMSVLTPWRLRFFSPNRLVHHIQLCDFYTIYLFYIYFTCSSLHWAHNSSLSVCLDPLSVHFLVWPEGRYIVQHMLFVHTAPSPKHKHFFFLNYTSPEWTRGRAVVEQTAVTVCVKSPVTQRHLRHKGMMSSDRCGGGRGKKAPEWQARTGSQLLWRQLGRQAGRQAHTEPTRRGKWLNTPRTSNDFFYNFNSPSSAHTTPTLPLQYNSRLDRFFF